MRCDRVSGSPTGAVSYTLLTLLNTPEAMRQEMH
jgi:hypothetical protein